MKRMTLILTLILSMNLMAQTRPAGTLQNAHQQDSSIAIAENHLYRVFFENMQSCGLDPVKFKNLDDIPSYMAKSTLQETIDNLRDERECSISDKRKLECLLDEQAKSAIMGVLVHPEFKAHAQQQLQKQNPTLNGLAIKTRANDLEEYLKKLADPQKKKPGKL